MKFDRSHVASFGESAIRIETVYYVLDPDYKKYMDVQQAINLAVLDRFGAEQREVRVPEPHGVQRNGRRRQTTRQRDARLHQALDPASVDRDRLSGDVARALRRQERRERGKLARLAEPAHRDLALESRHDVLRASCPLSPPSHRRAVRLARCACSPGRMLLTVMPSVATSLASVRAKPVTAARMLFESIRLSTGCLAAIDVTLMIAPPPPLAHARQHGARQLDRASQREIHGASHASHECSRTVPPADRRRS